MTLFAFLGLPCGQAQLHAFARPHNVNRPEDRLLHADGKGLLPAAVGPTVGDAAKKQSAFGFNPLGFRHPIIEPFAGESALYRKPGHTFTGVDALLTNFHLPRSSLLVLVSALAGVDLIRAAYEEAIRQEYRFYSYGDAMLIL